LLLERVVAAAAAERKQRARDEPVDERHLELIAVRDLDAQQIRVLDVDPALRTARRAPYVQAIVRDLAHAFDLFAEIRERLLRRIQNADARARPELRVDAGKRRFEPGERRRGRV